MRKIEEKFFCEHFNKTHVPKSSFALHAALSTQPHFAPEHTPLQAPARSVTTVRCNSLPTTPSPKSPPQCVSYSEAASGLLTGYQGTDARASLPGSRYSVRRR